MAAPVFRELVFVWACVALMVGCALAALTLRHQKFLLGLSEQFIKLPPSTKTVIVTAIIVATVFAQKPANVSTNQHESARAEVTMPAAPNAEETEVGRHGEGVERDAPTVASETPTNTPCLSNSVTSVLSESNPPVVTSNDVARGYRLETVRTNEAYSYERPANARFVRGYRLETVRTNAADFGKRPTHARLVGTWHLTDAYRGRARAQLDGFRFPIGGHVVTSLWAHTWGKVRPQLRNASNEIFVIGAPMFARHDQSYLWTAATTNGSILLTWENFFLGNPYERSLTTDSHGLTRIEGDGPAALNAEKLEIGRHGEASKKSLDMIDKIDRIVEAGASSPPNPVNPVNPVKGTPCLSNSVASVLSDSNPLVAHPSVNAQLELFPNGDFVARSNEVERVYRRVNPDDWDDDGIPNAEDAAPLAPADEPQFGPHQTLPEGANTNHYYWIDLAVPSANARVTFEGDGASDLPDPDFIAKAGETNRVTLLIGKTYAVRSALQSAIVGRSDSEVETIPNGQQTTVRWPLQIDYVDVASLQPSGAARRSRAAGGGGTTMRIRPPRAKGGTYSWPGRFCCYTLEADGTPVFSCDGACGCGGCSTGDVVYRYAGYEFTFGSWSCGCSRVSPDEPPRPGDGEEETQPASASVSVRFTKNAVIFENEHEQAPGVKVPRRSTRTTLVCSASGGPNGGVARFEATGDSRILRISGRELPFERRLEAGESFEEEIVYEGRKGWSSGVKVTGTFTDDDPDAQVPESVARLNVAEVEISVQNFTPANKSLYRHKFGICETICCNVYPMGVPLRWEASDGGVVDSDGRYRCPSIPAVNTLKAICGDAEFVPNITVVEPDGIEARNPQCYPYKVSAGRAGWIGLKQEFYVRPLDVSFVGIAMEEVPSTVGRRSGYFARPGFDVIGCHSKAMGAGKWMPIDRDNKMGEHDIASISLELLRVNDDGELTDNPAFGWEDGWITWEVPFGWTSAELAKEDENALPLKTFDPQAGHRFEITPSGLVTVRKFGNSAQREANGLMYCNGIEWKEEE